MWKFAGKTTKPRWFELRSTSGRKKQPRRRQADDSLTWTSPIETNAGIASARSGLMAYPKSYRYTKEHEWIEMKGDLATIGITDHAQHELGDVVFVELPKPGAKIEAGKSFGTVASRTAFSDSTVPYDFLALILPTSMVSWTHTLSPSSLRLRSV